jgi:hypothetical protein
MAGYTDIKLEDIDDSFIDTPAPYLATVGFREAIVSDFESSRTPRRRNMFQILRLFHDKLCCNPRDRIYSLLELCDDRDKFEVDYDMTTRELIGNLLKNCGNRFCLCTADFLGHILGVGHSLHLTGDLGMAQPPFAFMELPVTSKAAFKRSKPGNTYAIYDSTLTAPRVRCTTLSIHIDLKDLCIGSYSHGNMSMSASSISPSTNSFDSAVDIITYEHKNCATAEDEDDIPYPEPSFKQTLLSPSKAVYGCTIDITDDYDVCTIKLSLDMLLELATALRLSLWPQWRACCGRVTNIDWNQDGRYREPILHLCPRETKQ